MARPDRRRTTLRLESLEAREVMSAGGPSGEVQAVIERINAARVNPSAAIDWALSDASLNNTLDYYGVDRNQLRQEFGGIAARPALAWDPSLQAAAQGQSDYQASVGQQTHQGAGGSDLSARIKAAGYGDFSRNAENAYAYAQSPDHAMRAFLIDWGVPDRGHIRNMLQTDANQQSLTDVGVGIAATGNNNLGPNVVTLDFARKANPQAQLLGVAYNDNNSNGYYDAGEGQGNVVIDAVKLQDGQPTGEVHSIQTWDQSGAYQMPLAPGSYKVTASFGGKVIRKQDVTIGADNVKVDYRLNDAWDGSALNGAAPQAAPVAKQDAPAVLKAVTPPAPVVIVPATPAVVTPSTTEVLTAAKPATPVSYTYAAVIDSWYEYSNK